MITQLLINFTALAAVIAALVFCIMAAEPFINTTRREYGRFIRSRRANRNQNKRR